MLLLVHAGTLSKLIKKCAPLWHNCKDGTLLCYLSLLGELALPGISYYCSQGRNLIHICLVRKDWKNNGYDSQKDQGPVSWRPTTVKWRQFSQSNRHSTIGTRQTEYHEALPSSANDEVRCDCTFADDGISSWHSVCRVPMVEWRLDCEDCRHLTVVGLHDTGPRLTPLTGGPKPPSSVCVLVTVG